MSAPIEKSTWKKVKFGDVVRNVNETVSGSATTLDRAIAMEHLEPGCLEVKSWGEAAETTFTRSVKPGQTLFGKRRAYQRKVAYASFEAVCSGDILTLETVDPTKLLGELLPFLCTTEPFFEHAVGTSAGSLSPRTRWSDLASYEFLLPPIGEQKRIADLLWSIEHEREVACQLVDSAESVLRALRRASFCIGNPSTADSAFEISMGRQRSPKHTTGRSPVPYLRAANVKPGALDISDVQKMDFTRDEVTKFSLRNGDVVVTEGCGSAEQIGAAAQWRGEMPGPVCFQNTLLRFRNRPGITDPEWMKHWTQFAFDEGLFRRVASGTGILHIGSDRVKTIEVRLQSLAEQASTVRRLDEAVAVVEAAVIQRERAERLLHAIQAQVWS